MYMYIQGCSETRTNQPFGTFILMLVHRLQVPLLFYYAHDGKYL